MNATSGIPQAATAQPHWPRGVPHALRVPRVTLDDYLEVAARRYPDKPAILFGGACLSYAVLWAQVQALAGYLQQRLGVQSGDRVLLQSQNCPQFTIASYAIFRAGAVLVPVSAMTTAHELRYYASDSGARVAIVAQELLASVQPCMADGLLDAAIVHAYSDMLPAQPDAGLSDAVTAQRAPLPAGNYHGFQAALGQALAPAPRSVGPDDLALLPYTSGTTGHPKGCMHTHSTALAPVVASQQWRGTHADMVSLAVAPMFHMLGMQAGMNAPLFTGATVVMMPRWDALQAARLIARHRVNVWSAPPSMVIDLFAQAEQQGIDVSSLVLLGGGGAAMPEAVATMLAERFGLHYNEAYGLTETAAFLHANPV